MKDRQFQQNMDSRGGGGMVGKGKPRLDRCSRAAVIVTSIVSILFCSAAAAPVVAQKTETGTVTGQVAIKGVGPMLEGTVLFFDKAGGPPPSPSKYWRVPTYTFKLDDNAQFKAKLPAGAYYIGAIEKISGEPIEQPQEGEYFFISQDRNGKPRTFTVRNNKKLNLGMSTAPKPFARTSAAGEGITAIEGTIRNEKGEPVEGILVFAATKPGRSGRPLFVSERSDKDGKYQLRVHRGGNYYLRARQVHEGTPAINELVGVYKNGKAIAVTTAATRKDIDIEVQHAAAAGPQP